MNKQPVYYLQTDPRWKDKPYRVPGESATVGNSGCGPSCAAMLIETLTGKTYTPEDACNWSVQHGYKALKQGTYYAYFRPQFAEFGIDCDQLSWVNTYGNPDHANHDKALELLMQGYYIIACMGPGTWTTSGHFVVLWWQDGKVRINDPASTAAARLSGDIRTFRSQVKYYWWVDAREYNNGPVDMTDMTASGTVTASSLNVRSGPGTAYSIVGSLPLGTVVPITGVSGDWYQIQFGTASAWVSAKYINITLQEDDEMVIYKTLDDVPEYYRDAVQKVVDKGVLNGTGDGLNISEDICRILTVLNRLGKLD